MSHGTTRAKVRLPTHRTSSAPSAPPTSDGTVIQASSRLQPATSWRKPQKPPTPPGTSATVLVALAATGDSPNANSDGKVTSVPPPASAFMPPASAAAATSTTHIIASKIRDPTMTRDLPDAERLVRELQQKGWQPARSDIEPLFALLASGDKE